MAAGAVTSSVTVGGSLALGVRRGRRGKAGGHVTSSSTGGQAKEAISKPIKQVRFAAMADWYEIQDDGFDDFTFDNFNADGTPRVSQHNGRRIGPPARKLSSTAATLWAQYKALLWITGGVDLNLPDARIIGHSGRQFQIEIDPDDEGDVPFWLDQDVLNKPFNNYTFRRLAIWEAETVCYLDSDADCIMHLVCQPHDEGLDVLASRWHEFCHTGLVPPEPVAGDVTSMARAGTAKFQPGLEWTVDSGAGLYMANISECKSLDMPLHPVPPFLVSGVGGEQIIEEKATISLQEFGISIHAAALDSPFNLICLHCFLPG